MKPKKPEPTAKRKKFGSSRAHGLQVEYAFAAKYPLSDGKTKQLHSAVEEVVRKNRKGYSRFFVSLLMTVLGGLYQVRMMFTDDDDEEEDAKWEHQWVSTPVVKQISKLHDELDELLDETIDFQVAERPAKLLRYRVVFLSNKK